MPHYAFTPGFILTYLASFAMILFARTRLPAGMRMVVAAIPAQMLLLPFILYAFGIFTWGAVALNPLVIPLASLLLAFFPFLVLAPCPLYADIGEALSRWVTGLITSFDRIFWTVSFVTCRGWFRRGLWSLHFTPSSSGTASGPGATWPAYGRAFRRDWLFFLRPFSSQPPCRARARCSWMWDRDRQPWWRMRVTLS